MTFSRANCPLRTREPSCMKHRYIAPQDVNSNFMQISLINLSSLEKCRKEIFEMQSSVRRKGKHIKFALKLFQPWQGGNVR